MRAFYERWLWIMKLFPVQESRLSPRAAKARFNSIRFIFWLLGFEVDEIAVVNQFANERVDLPQGKLWATFEIATNEAEFMHSHFQSHRAGLFDRGGAELLGQGEDAEDT